MDVNVIKDRKGPCFFISHKRVGFTEGIWLSLDELIELRRLLDDIL